MEGWSILNECGARGIVIIQGRSVLLAYPVGVWKNRDMNAVTFDTLKYANTLKEAGVDSKQAEAQAKALSDVMEVNLKELATKGDLSALKKDLEALKKDLQVELQKELTPIKADILLLKWMVGVIVAGVVALVIKAFLHV